MKLCKLFALMLSLVLCTALALPAMATNVITAYTPDEGTLTISYTYEDDDGVVHALKYVNFNVYLVATLEEDHTLANTSNFTSIALSDGLFYDQELLIETRNILENYIDTNTFAPDYTVLTDASGDAEIDLPFGLYYTDAEVFWDDETTGETVSAYYSTPFLVQIGAYDPERGEHIYDYEVMPKVSTLSLSDDSYPVTVQKKWENTEHTTLPSKIEVSLYCNGCADSIGETVTLNAANNWSYTWHGLDANHTWAVDELTVLTDYTTQYETKIIDEQLYLIITNTYTGEPDPTPKPTTSPPPPPPTTPDITIILPQTGSNLPYVPVFAGLGLAFLLAGALLKKGGDAK